MWQQLTVAVLVFACGLWLLWNVILPARLKRAIAGRNVAPGGGCHGCAMSTKGCPSAARSTGIDETGGKTSTIRFDGR